MQEIIAYDSYGNSLTNLVQWDIDVYVYLSADKINSAYKVHFFNNTLEEALVVESTYSNGILKVKIPNTLLSQPHIIIGYVHVVENGESKSLYCFKINVRKKPKPSSYISVDSQDWIEAETVLKECADYAKAASQSEANAKTYSEQAGTYAEQASASATNAATSSTNASIYASNASTYATNASNSANNAANSADLAKSYAVGGTSIRTGEDTDNSKYYSEQAKESADNADNSETNAKASENAAANSATNANASKQAAQTAATNAATSASNAKTSEDNAAASATSANASKEAAALSESNANSSATAAGNSANAANASAIAAAKAKQDILDMVVSVDTLNPGQNATVKYTVDEDGKISVEYGIPKGYDGYTPAKGVDYFTEAEIDDIVSSIVDQIDPDGTSTQHVHTNKSLLDSITDADKDKWDSDARPVRILTITLPVADWNNGIQTITNSNIDSSDFYMYMISPELNCEIAYNDAFVRAKDIDTDTKLVFTCQKVPVVDLSVRVLIFSASN